MLVSSGSVAAVVLAAAKSKSSGSGFINLIFLLAIVGAVMLFMRRGRSRQRQVTQARNNVAPGVEVVTTAGIIATVVDGDDETVTLEIAPGVRSKFLRQAIARVVVPPGPDEPGLPDYPSAQMPEHPDDAPPEPRQP